MRPCLPPCFRDTSSRRVAYALWQSTRQLTPVARPCQAAHSTCRHRCGRRVLLRATVMIVGLQQRPDLVAVAAPPGSRSMYDGRRLPAPIYGRRIGLRCPTGRRTVRRPRGTSRAHPDRLASAIRAPKPLSITANAPMATRRRPGAVHRSMFHVNHRDGCAVPSYESRPARGGFASTRSGQPGGSCGRAPLSRIGSRLILSTLLPDCS